MAYNKASEERKWRLWKEAEEKQLRELGVSEEKIAQLRAYDWEMFNSDRRYYEHHAEGGDYLELLAASEEEPDAKTVSDFLSSIDSPVLFRLLSETDPITILIALRRSQGKSFAEISREIGLSENTAHRRWTRLKKYAVRQFRTAKYSGSYQMKMSINSLVPCLSIQQLKSVMMPLYKRFRES